MSESTSSAHSEILRNRQGDGAVLLMTYRGDW